MGIYTDYGRFLKARQFKEYCNSGAGLWFSFSMGSQRWDTIGEETNGGEEPTNKFRPLVPPSSPNAYSPVYSWVQSFKNTPTLVKSEESLLDPSWSSSDVDPKYWSPYKENYTDASLYPYTDPFKVTQALSPSWVFWNNGDPQAIYPFNNTTSNIPSKYYPSAYIPPFSVSYLNDWSSFTPYADTSTQPTNPDDFLQYALTLHLEEGEACSLPIGLLSFIKGNAQFVSPITEEEVSQVTPGTPDAMKIFKYGAHYWKIISDISRDSLPHHILLTANVFPGDLSLDAIADVTLPVRQVSVFKFPDSLSTIITSGRYVIRRKDMNILWTDPSTGEEDSPVEGKKNLPFNCESPIDGAQSIEMIINDCLTARTRVVQQTDRYGYIIGF